MKQHQLRKLNRDLTNCVISLHQKGYTDDFQSISTEKVQCIQNGECFTMRELRIKLIDCGYDLLTRTYKYIHTIDTEVGYRGLLITNGILALND